MSDTRSTDIAATTVVLVRDSFADSSGWNGAVSKDSIPELRSGRAPVAASVGTHRCERDAAWKSHVIMTSQPRAVVDLIEKHRSPEFDRPSAAHLPASPPDISA